MSFMPRRKGFRAAVTTTLLAAVLPFSAASQEVAFTVEQCREAQIIGNAVMKKYSISDKLAESYRNFIYSGCNMGTDWKLVTPADQQAFGEYRVRLIALRSADAGKPATLANR